MNRAAAIAVLLVCAWPALAGWSPAWTNGTIWLRYSLYRDLYDAVNERCAWSGGTNTALPVPSIWPSWPWVCRVDSALQSLAPSFCNPTLTNAAGHYTNAAPPMLTFTGALDQAAITNAAGYPVFRRDATNFTIWPRLVDLRQRRDALARLQWTRILWANTDLQPDGGLRWVGTTSGPSGAVWADLYRGASNNYASASWSSSGYYAIRQTEAYKNPSSGGKTATVTREATRFDFAVQSAWTNWTRDIDVYLRPVSYIWDGDSLSSGADMTEVEYYGDQEDVDMLPSFTATTNNPHYNSPQYHRTYSAPSGTVWTSFWIGDTNGVMPTAWPSHEAGTGGTNTVAHGYRYTVNSPATWRDPVVESPSFGKHLILKWEARYP